MWVDSPFIQSLNVQTALNLNINLEMQVSKIFVNNSWNISLAWYDFIPFLEDRLEYIYFVENLKDDMLCWNHSANAILDSKETFRFISKHAPIVPWVVSLLNKDIPPSKSLLVWRQHHKKIPTVEQMRMRGFMCVSKCSICNCQEENT